jgi:transposase-like protein
MGRKFSEEHKRNISKALKGKRKKFFLTKEQLIDLYQNQKLSIGLIAKKLNLSPMTIEYWMKQWEIPRRNLSEADKLVQQREETKRKPYRKWTKEKIIEELKIFAQKIGHSPTYNELMKNYRGLFEAIKAYIGTLNEAKKLAGLECYYEDREFWTKEKVIQKLKEITLKLGHSPTQKEIIKENKKLVGAIRRFGGLNKLKKEIGLKISHYRIKPLPENKDKPTFELGYIIGCLLGDGYITSGTSSKFIIGLSVKDRDFAEYFAKQLEKWSGFSPSIHFIKYKKYGKEFYAWKVNFFGLNYYNFFKEKLGLIKNNGKWVPTKLNWIYSMPEEFKRGVVKGLWDSEGFIIRFYHKGIGLSMKNKEVVELFSKLCNQLGINTCKVTSNKKVYYAKILKDRMKFIDKIGITIQRKFDMIKSW